MSLAPEDKAYIADVVGDALRQFADRTMGGGYRPSSPMEAGSPEFAEDRTQINSLNNKWLFDGHLNLSLTAQQRAQVNFDNLQQISLRALNESVDLAAKLHARTLANLDQSAADLASINAQKLRCEADNAYVTRYDLSNPVTTGSGDALRSASYPANRAVDTASAGVAAGVAEDVQGNVTTQLSALTTQVMALANAVTNQQAVFTTALQALTDSNASIAASLAKLAGAK